MKINNIEKFRTEFYKNLEDTFPRYNFTHLDSVRKERTDYTGTVLLKDALEVFIWTNVNMAYEPLCWITCDDEFVTFWKDSGTHFSIEEIVSFEDYKNKTVFMMDMALSFRDTVTYLEKKFNERGEKIA